MNPFTEMKTEIKKIVEQKYKGTDYKENYIAFVDIMGMKSLLKSEYGVLRKIFNNIEVQLRLYNRMSISGEKSFMEQVQVSIISDSLVISIECTENNALSKLIGFTSNIINSALDIIDEMPIFYRGGITKGKIYHDDFCVFGPGLSRAYKLESEIAKNFRCIFDESLLQDLQFKNYLETDHKNSTLIIDTNDNYYYINYIKNGDPSKLMKYSKQIVNGKECEKIKDKYRWLLERLEESK